MVAATRPLLFALGVRSSLVYPSACARVGGLGCESAVPTLKVVDDHPSPTRANIDERTILGLSLFEWVCEHRRTQELGLWGLTKATGNVAKRRFSCLLLFSSE